MSISPLFERTAVPVRKTRRTRSAPQEIIPAKKKEKAASKDSIPLRTKIIGGVALSAVMAGGWVLDKGEVEDTCTSPTQQMIQVGAVGTDNGMLHTKNRIRNLLFLNDGRTISDIAETLSHDRGYTVTTERIAAVNAKQSFIRFDQQGDLINSMPVEDSKGGSFCVSVPGPIYNGYHLVQSDTETLQDIATDNKVSIETLAKLNPSLEVSSNEPLPLSSTVKLTKDIDTSLAYRTMEKSEQTVNAMSDTAKERDHIVMANIALVSSGVALTPGNEAFLPLETTDFMKEKKISTETLVKTFDADSVALDVTFAQLSPKKETDKKSPKAEKKDTTASLESATDIPAGIKSSMLAIYPKSDHVPAAVLAGQVKTESNFRPNAVSSANAKGLTQFLDGTWKDWGKGGDPFNPDDALNAQVAYMNYLYDWADKGVKDGRLKGDTLTLSIQAYNWGFGNVESFGRVATTSDIGAHFGNGNSVPEEAVDYPRKVFDASEAYGFTLNNPRSFNHPSLRLSTKTDITKGWEPRRYPGSSIDADGFTPNLRRLNNELKHVWNVPWVGGIIEPGDPTVGHSSTSDHYDGHALDVMLDPREKNDNQYRQEEMTNWLVANAGRLNIKYVIVNDQIWSPARRDEGWRDYATSEGTFEKPTTERDYILAHYDHIHVSVY